MSLTADEIPAHIGAKVRALRTAQGLSGRQLAAVASVSQPFLSQLEAGRSSIAIATLYRLSAALGVNPSELLPVVGDSDVEVVRAPEVHRLPITEAPDSAIERAVFRSGKRITEFGDFVIEPDQDVSEWFASGAEHVFYVVDGAIRVEFDGYPDVTLEAGDAVFFAPWIRNRWQLISDTPARLILVAAGE